MHLLSAFPVAGVGQGDRGNQLWQHKMSAVYLGYFFYIFIYHVVHSDELLEQLEEEKEARKNAEEKINELKGGLQHF